MSEEKYLSVDDMAKKAGLSKYAIYTKLKKHGIEADKIDDNKRLWKESTIEKKLGKTTAQTS